MFIAVFADIFGRRDLSGWGKAGWVLLIFIIPLIGILIYLIPRPSELGQSGQAGLRDLRPAELTLTGRN